MSDKAHPWRMPPPLDFAYTTDKDGVRHPVIRRVQPPECGQKVELRDIGWVQCVRTKGHHVGLDYANTNGYVSWAFDAEPDDA